MHVYEVRPRRDHRGVDLISDVLPFGRLWYDTPDHAIGYAMHYSRSHDAVIRVYDEADNVIQTHEPAGTTRFAICLRWSGGLSSALASIQLNTRSYENKKQPHTHRACALLGATFGGTKSRVRTSHVVPERSYLRREKRYPLHAVASPCAREQNRENLNHTPTGRSESRHGN